MVSMIFISFVGPSTSHGQFIVLTVMLSVGVFSVGMQWQEIPIMGCFRGLLFPDNGPRSTGHCILIKGKSKDDS